MNQSQLIAPNYTETEVWDLLSNYLEKKFDADLNTVQRGIYVDLYRNGSFFTIVDSPDEFAYLYCSRNLNFNISGSIVFSDDSDCNEEFTLESICDYLNKPFPKASILLELTSTEIAEKQKNLSFANKVNKADHDREKYKKVIVGACVELIHAFEYKQALIVEDSIYHIEQLIGEVQSFNFIQERNFINTDKILVIHPNPITLDDLLVFIEEKKELIKNYFNLKYKDVLDCIQNEIYPNYDNYFSEHMRRFGSLLIPLHNTENEIVSCVNIANITNEEKNYLVVSEKNKYTHGSFQINANQITSDQPIFITLDLETADSLSRCSENPIFAAINVDNFIRVFDEIQAKYPDNFLVLVSNNPFSEYLNHQDPTQFRESVMVKLMLAFAVNNARLVRCGIIMPTVDLSEISKIKSFCDIFLEFGIDELKFQVDSELNKALDRLTNNINESEFIKNIYDESKSSIYGNHNLRIPELVTEEELSPPKIIKFDKPPEKLIIPTYGVDSVLHIESRKSLSEWFNEPMNKDIQRKEQQFQKRLSDFVSATPVSIDEDFNPRPIRETFP